MADPEHRGPRPTGFDTLSLHAGQRPDAATGARATPIYQSASFVFPDTDFAVGLFNIERAGHVYSRLSNPTNAVLEERISALEGGVGAIATASGQAAMHLAVATLASAGDHIVASRSLYGGTHNLLEYTLPRFGIETTFVRSSRASDQSEYTLFPPSDCPMNQDHLTPFDPSAATRYVSLVRFTLPEPSPSSQAHHSVRPRALERRSTA